MNELIKGLIAEYKVRLETINEMIEVENMPTGKVLLKTRKLDYEEFIVELEARV
jgi:hypothetical protein